MRYLDIACASIVLAAMPVSICAQGKSTVGSLLARIKAVTKGHTKEGTNDPGWNQATKRAIEAALAAATGSIVITHFEPFDGPHEKQPGHTLTTIKKTGENERGFTPGWEEREIVSLNGGYNRGGDFGVERMDSFTIPPLPPPAKPLTDDQKDQLSGDFMASALVHEATHAVQSQKFDPNNEISREIACAKAEIAALENQIEFAEEMLNQPPYAPETDDNANMREALERFIEGLKGQLADYEAKLEDLQNQ